MARRRSGQDLILEANFSRGIVRDVARTAIPDGGLYDCADWLVHEPGRIFKRGGTSYAGPAMTGSTYAAAVAYAEFPAGSKLIGIGDDGHMFTVTSGTTTDIATLGSGFPPVDTPKLRIGGSKNLLIIPSTSTSVVPKTYDGTTVANLGGSPPKAKFCAIYKTRVCLANGSDGTVYNSRIWFSPTPDPTATWDTTNAWIDCDHPLTGLAGLNNVLLCFSQGHMERIIGDTPPPGSNMDRALVGNVGCTDARSIVIFQDNCVFANPGGVYLTNGAAFRSLTKEGGIERYWQGLFTGYDPSTYTIAAGLLGKSFYFVNVLDSNRAVASLTAKSGSGLGAGAMLLCHLPTSSWTRLSNCGAMMFATAVGVSDELYFADATTNQITALSGIFSPAAGNKNDANGTAVTGGFETRALGSGTGIKHFMDARVSLDVRDAASDNPTLAVYTAPGLEASTFAAVAESPLTETTDADRKRVTVAARDQVVTVRLVQAHASSKSEVYALEVEQRPLALVEGGHG